MCSLRKLATYLDPMYSWDQDSVGFVLELISAVPAEQLWEHTQALMLFYSRNVTARAIHVGELPLKMQPIIDGLYAAVPGEKRGFWYSALAKGITNINVLGHVVNALHTRDPNARTLFLQIAYAYYMLDPGRKELLEAVSVII